MNKITIIILFLLFFLSRFFFINSNAIFFDSQEYLNLFANANYLQAIVLGHFPPHEGYIILFWPIYQAAQLLHANGAFVVILFQIILSYFTLFFFYKFIEYISDKKTALYAAIIASFTPLFWIINVTVMMENAYAFFFFFSLYLLSIYLEKTKKEYFLHGSLILLMLAVLTQPIIIFWTPLYFSVVFLKKKKLSKKIFIFLITYIIVFLFLNILLISSVLRMSPLAVFHELYLSKGGEFAELSFSLKGFLIAMRNFIIPLLQNNTILLVILGFISLVVSFKKDKKIFVYGILFILPALYANQWWDSLLNGRHALLAGFGIALLTAYLLRTKNVIYFILILCYILFVSFHTLSLLSKPIPYLEDAQFAEKLPKNSLFIESHFARPQVQTTVANKAFYVNEPGYSTELLTKELNYYMAKKEPIYITSAAISEPYGLYSGPYLHNVTLSYENQFELESVFINYKIIQYKIINNEDNLLIYKITAKKKSAYPSVKIMKDSYRRLDYADPFWQTTWWFENNFLKTNVLWKTNN